MDNQEDALLNYIVVMECPNKPLLAMTNGPICQSKFMQQATEEDPYLSQELLTQEKICYLYF